MIIFRMSDRETSDHEGENESGESENETQPQVGCTLENSISCIF